MRADHPHYITWTEEMDQTLMEMRSRKESYQKIADKLLVSESAVKRRYRVLKSVRDQIDAPPELTEKQIAEIYAGRRYDDVEVVKDCGRFTRTVSPAWSCHDGPFAVLRR